MKKPQQVINELMASDHKNPRNIELLKKIILTTHSGWLRINNLAPDNQVPLVDYLLDKERIMFDFTRLSDAKRTLFLQWLVNEHKDEKETAFPTNAYVNEYRGFTAEVALSWWGRLIAWFENRVSDRWKIADLNLSLDYQLTGIEMCHGEKGILIGFTQFSVPSSQNKYNNPKHSQSEPLGNTKRVFINDHLVDELTRNTDLDQFDFATLCSKPHRHSIHVADLKTRHEAMREYRNVQKFVDGRSWYIRLWDWCFSWFKKTPKKVNVANPLKLLHKSEQIEIYQHRVSQEIVVTEKKPKINDMVYCGGGGKIVAHVGVWKALQEAHITPKRFAGSSSGAIMALMCYLGYPADEISTLFKKFKKEHLVLFNIDSQGLSDTHSLKTAIDYLIAVRIEQIVTKHCIPYPKGPITFATLHKLGQDYPDCGIGAELIVTVTNIKSRKTEYPSFKATPNMEVSEAVTTSASLPLLFKPRSGRSDGGVLSNLPTEAFQADPSKTFLESASNNNFQILAVQFDTGKERSAVDENGKVYRENPFLNWLYGHITGVKDLASAWEQDRLKLRQYAGQSIVPKGEVSTSSFTINAATWEKMIKNGYEATQDYLKARYKIENGRYINDELLYSTFSSLSELLSYCCYRNSQEGFERVYNLIVQSSLANKEALIKHAVKLKQLYFPENNTKNPGSVNLDNPPPHSQAFRILYPIIVSKLTYHFVSGDKDKKLLEAAKCSISLAEPFKCLKYLEKIDGKIHIMLHILIKLIQELRKKPSPELYAYLQKIERIFSENKILTDKHQDKWDLGIEECYRTINIFFANKQGKASQFFQCLQKRSMPLQAISKTGFQNNFYDSDLDFYVPNLH